MSILVKHKNNELSSIIFEGTENETIDKIKELDLEDYHDSFFYERDKFENLGINENNNYEYYLIYENMDEFNKFNI
jgi:hypothetical protein